MRNDPRLRQVVDDVRRNDRPDLLAVNVSFGGTNWDHAPYGSGINASGLVVACSFDQCGASNGYAVGSPGNASFTTANVPNTAGSTLGSRDQRCRTTGARLSLRRRHHLLLRANLRLRARPIRPHSDTGIDLGDDAAAQRTATVPLVASARPKSFLQGVARIRRRWPKQKNHG